MTNTPNYNLLLAEGTDLVNYLTQTNPNFSNLDTILKAISDLTTTPATEVTTGTAHAITKSLPDATVIKFTATSNWQTGDTMTLDGSPVTPLKTDGTTLKTGDYIIGSAVLMIQDGARLTVLVASSPDAGDINYDNTVSGLASNKVQGAIDENAAAINTINSNLPFYKFWFNSSPGNDFAGQQIGVSGLSNYSYIEVVYRRYKGNNMFVTTGLVPVDDGYGCETVAVANAMIYTREFTMSKTNETITFTGCDRVGTYADNTGTTVQNSSLIPFMIIGHKN